MTAEEQRLDRLALAHIMSGQVRQRRDQFHQFGRRTANYQGFIQGLVDGSRGRVAIARLGIAHQDAPQEPRRDREEVDAVLPT